MGLADSKHFLHLVRAMVAEPEAGSHRWAESAGIPRATAFRLVRPFRFHGAVNGLVADPRKALHLAADLRKDRAMPDGNVRLTHAFEKELFSKPSLQLAFQSAANRLAFFESGELTIRIDTADAEPIWSAIAGGSGRRVNIYVEDLSRFPPPVDVDGVRVTDPVITLMDLYSHPRAGAHAEFLDGVLVEAGILPERRR